MKLTKEEAQARLKELDALIEQTNVFILSTEYGRRAIISIDAWEYWQDYQTIDLNIAQPFLRKV